MIDVLVLAAALAQSAPTAKPAQRIELGVLVTHVDGSTRRTTSYPGSPVIYVAGDSECADPKLSSKRPVEAFGWKASVVPMANDMGIAWTRLDDAALTRGAKNGTRVLPVRADGSWVALDHLDIKATPGCKIANWSLVARRTPYEVPAETRSQNNLVEAELWFVHKAPDGKETSQRQVVRVRKNDRGEFYFDDIEIQTRWLEQDIKLTVEVFGTLMVDEPKDGEIGILLNLTRRYLSKQFMIGAWPKSGNTQLPTSVALGEVVSFVLPPLQDDAGVFLGHRFSVRMRLKPLSPETPQG